MESEISPRKDTSKPTKGCALFYHVNRLIQAFWGIRLLRFLAVGAINTLFSYIIYAALVLLGMHYSLATLLSTILGIIFNFFTTGRLVFRNMNNTLFLRFAAVYGVTYLANVGFLYCLVDLIGMDKLIAGALVTLPVALLSYWLNARFTFGEKPETKQITIQGANHDV